ncbi:unnamed protein product [Vicia faba]|uniref:Late embryogenesis abundant protein LEA-2 subgroup domain-containing protein n=1 Tax=Vicia faba TaxID=3906 RepID=A0AAV1B209_VICFA|nr:unnamed protein product [Vicia faba]
MNSKSLKICLLVSITFLIIAATVILALAFTIFKPKNPYVSVHPLGLEDLEFFQPNSTSVPLKMLITIVNPNYGSFKSKNATGYLNYQDTVIANVPLEPKLLPARRTTNVTTTAGLMSGKLISDDSFLKDIEDSSFNLTAKATLHGKVYLIKIFKMKATVDIFCDIFFNISSLYTDSNCLTRIKV